jgi:hypothetical protein
VPIPVERPDQVSNKSARQITITVFSLDERLIVINAY